MYLGQKGVAHPVAGAPHRARGVLANERLSKSRRRRRRRRNGLVNGKRETRLQGASASAHAHAHAGVPECQSARGGGGDACSATHPCYVRWIADSLKNGQTLRREMSQPPCIHFVSWRKNVDQFGRSESIPITNAARNTFWLNYDMGDIMRVAARDSAVMRAFEYSNRE